MKREHPNPRAEERALTREQILAVREGDQAAFSLLLDRYRPLIESSVLRYSGEERSEFHRDDLRQEAVLVFYHSILTYDMEQSEVEFGLYAKICITHGLISQLRANQKHQAEQLSESLSNVLFVHDSEDPSVGILEQEREKALYSVIRQNLSAFEYRVWRLYMSGRTAKEVGELVGKDEKSISNAIYRIRKKLRALLQ